MIFVFGTRLYGSIERMAGTRIATQFFHVSFVPLIPLKSHLVLAEEGRRFRGIPLGLEPRSVLAGYARIWGPIGMIAAFAGLMDAAGGGAIPMDPAGVAAFGLMGLVALVATVAAWGFVGRLSLDERGQRLVYGTLAGRPMDVARMEFAQRARLYDAIRKNVIDRAQGLASTGYRTAFDPATQWAAIAMDPSVNDPGFLSAALTLARLEWAAAVGPARAQLRSAHDAIWQKLRGLDPRVLEAARTA